MAGRTEHFDPRGAQGIGNTRGQRAFRADENEVDFFIAAKRHDLFRIARIDVAAVGRAAVAGRDEDHVAVALQGAGHGVFASARSEHEDPHARENSKVSFGATPEMSTGYFPVKQAVQ